MWRIFIVSYRYRAIATSSHAPASPPSSLMKSRRLRFNTGLSLPPAIPTQVWKVPANDGPVRSVYLGASLPRNARQVLETDLDRLYPRRRASRSDDDIQRWRRALCGPLFDLEAELIDQCAPLAFLALDVGGVLLRRAG